MWVDLLVLLNLASSLYLTGLIWFVQIVHYRLFELVGRENFASYEGRHQSLTTWVVAPAMLIELAASILLVWNRPTTSLCWLTGALTLLVWASTMLIQVPLHGNLSTGFDLEACRRLVASNWVRTIAWSLRSVLLLWALAERLKTTHG